MTEIEAFLTGGDALPDPLHNTLKDMVRRHASSHPRHLQSRLGPSEVGHPCLRKLAQGLLFAGHSGNPPDPINPPGDPLPSYIGVAAHSKMEDAAALDNTRIEAMTGDLGRWITERKVTVREDLTGTCDLYDTWTNTVIDYKFPGTTAMTQYRKDGPSQEYRVQAHLYGAGYLNEGYHVERVAIWFLPRAGQLATSHLWSEPYDQGIVDATLAKIDLAVAMLADLDVDRHPERLALIPRTPKNCSWCPYWSPIPHPSPAACQGDSGPVNDTMLVSSEGKLHRETGQGNQSGCSTPQPRKSR